MAITMIIAISYSCQSKPSIPVPENLIYRQLLRISNQKSFQNTLGYELTNAGLTYQKLINTAAR